MSDRTIVGPWLLSLSLWFAAAWSTVPERFSVALVQRRLQSLTWPSFRAWSPWLGVMIVAAVPRLIWLDRFPTILDGDEGLFMIVARDSQAGLLPNAFGTGPFGHPNLYFAVEGWFASWFGGGVPGYRTLSALVGTIGVLAAWRFGRLVLGPHALVGAIILAVLPLHLHFSRWALNNVMDPTALILALLFLIRAIRRRGAVDAVLCGVMLGLGWYGYFGARIFPGDHRRLARGFGSRSPIGVPRCHSSGGLGCGWIRGHRDTAHHGLLASSVRIRGHRRSSRRFRSRA